MAGVPQCRFPLPHVSPDGRKPEDEGEAIQKSPRAYTSSPYETRIRPRRCRPRCIHHSETEQFYLPKRPDAPFPALSRSHARCSPGPSRAHASHRPYYVATSAVRQAAIAHRPPPPSYRAMPSPLSAHTSKRSRAHDAVPLTTIPESTVASSSSPSTSAAAVDFHSTLTL
ncbi:hypothetical protein C8J57DRAFT_1391666 [Mycena rebaudengoi]|nr:hypothetical protein C8J57DRAFT_1391666 [Mycena rebaudengoi]